MGERRVPAPSPAGAASTASPHPAVPPSPRRHENPADTEHRRPMSPSGGVETIPELGKVRLVGSTSLLAECKTCRNSVLAFGPYSQQLAATEPSVTKPAYENP
eukprot:3540359-Pyramimonas_sp.AAC.2